MRKKEVVRLCNGSCVLTAARGGETAGSEGDNGRGDLTPEARRGGTSAGVCVCVCARARACVNNLVKVTHLS